MLRKQGGHIGQLAEIPRNKSPPWHMPRRAFFLPLRCKCCRLHGMRMVRSQPYATM